MEVTLMAGDGAALDLFVVGGGINGAGIACDAVVLTPDLPLVHRLLGRVPSRFLGAIYSAAAERPRMDRRADSSPTSRVTASCADIRSAVIRRSSAIRCSARSRSTMVARNSVWWLDMSPSSFAISDCNTSMLALSAVAVVDCRLVALMS